ncbi:hypothetical protein CMV_005285 [Castanea mollissima]|uniref:Prolamin-like domain-containing protein n=1 Tax=Castanea mollissima TaxID=60419 RepID=A0A8J4RE02_9ROSI|nr:hypothetical protein CMV_005285 [Castanea mollissima]
MDGRGVFVVVAIEVVEESGGGGGGSAGGGGGGGGVFAGLFEFVFVFDLDFDLARLSSQHLSSNGSSCCNAITEIEGNCLSNLFPSNPIFALLLNNSYGQPSKGNGQVSGITASKAALPKILLGNQDIQECWSSLSGVPGYLTDVINSLFNGRVNFFGATCCKAISLANDHCLPKLFPFNSNFHSTFKNVCLIGSEVGGPTPSP